MSREIAKKFYTSGSTTTLVQYSADALTDKVEAGIYELRSSMMGLYLQRKCTTYALPKLYGSIVRRASKIMGTFNDRETSTGVLLSGDKGTGKSLLSMLLANIAVSEGNPVIEVKEAFYGASFEELMNAIPNAVLIFDEFAKVYKVEKDTDNNPQEKLLGFFDGAGAKKRLMIFTENKTSGINEFMLNRPGRIFYHYKYSKLTPDVIQEYCEEKGLVEDKIQYLQNFAISANEFSFDILKAIVEEILRYPTDEVKELIDDLNIQQGDMSKNIKVVHIADTTGKQFVIFDQTNKEHEYKLNRYSTWVSLIPRDPEMAEEAVNKAQKDMEDYLKDYPEETSTSTISDFLPRIPLSLSHKTMTVKGNVTLQKVDEGEGYVVGITEVVKPLVNYYGQWEGAF